MANATPALAIRITGGHADVHYFPEEGHPGFRALAEPPVPTNHPIVFVFEGCDPASDELTPSEFVLPVSIALAVAKEFCRTGTRSSSVSWFEL